MEGLSAFIGVLVLAYAGPLVILVCPVLLVPVLRRRLTRLDFAAVLYPALVWTVLTIVSSRPKGMTNAYTELFLLAVAVAVAVYLRATFRKITEARLRTLFIPAVALLSAAGLCVAVPPFQHYDLVRAWWYVRQHPELAEPAREAILRGVVLVGMSLEQAAIAAGPYGWESANGKLTRLSFNNLSQFGSGHPIPFNAHIVYERVHQIERLHDLEPCRTYLRTPKAETVEYPYAGFWKEDCAQSFGLRFERGGAGQYAIRFCGPGGCMEPSYLSDCTPIPDGRNYELVDKDTVVVRRGSREELYKRCAP